MILYGPVPGVRVEPVGSMWAAFSPLSGQTHILNTEAAAILELVAECQPADPATLIAALGADIDEPAHTRQSLSLVIDLTCAFLASAGLIARLPTQRTDGTCRR